MFFAANLKQMHTEWVETFCSVEFKGPCWYWRFIVFRIGWHIDNL